MSSTIRLAVLGCLSSSLVFAEYWSGALVDSKCYESEERNVNPTDTLTSVDRDGALEVRYCTANAKTRSFALVPWEGPALRLDTAGNAKAAAMMRSLRKQSPQIVTISGQLQKNVIEVDSIAPAPE
ncbi:MAG TPA: hypothetical protein VG273_22170 [Bryobacteraceae bacterium]|jgi:hypothetical protein|nr:hypothetical protein [Bryobacteraceae bacterium]